MPERVERTDPTRQCPVSMAAAEVIAHGGGVLSLEQLNSYRGERGKWAAVWEDQQGVERSEIGHSAGAAARKAARAQRRISDRLGQQ